MRVKAFFSLLLAVVMVTTAPAVALGASTTTATGTTTAASSLPAPTFGLGSANQATTPATTTTVVPSTTTSSSGGGLGRTDAILIGVVTAGLLVGIWVFMMRDARRRTRTDPDLDDDPLGFKRKGTKAPPRSRKLKPAERKRRKRGRAPRRR